MRSPQLEDNGCFSTLEILPLTRERLAQSHESQYLSYEAKHTRVFLNFRIRGIYFLGVMNSFLYSIPTKAVTQWIQEKVRLLHYAHKQLA